MKMMDKMTQEEFIDYGASQVALHMKGLGSWLWVCADRGVVNPNVEMDKDFWGFKVERGSGCAEMEGRFLIYLFTMNIREAFEKVMFSRN